ncbi:hypothetical protein SteCoe_15595 [Stentor coeruleus]|uniref:Uncharacterized protein n=1 Tax=Stentor coeruleus TaxID=5963 RepID=A0A1R2C399_9CILI|nr:hypothetical protein SteCoe_15595 [Stentor coeruleus]
MFSMEILKLRDCIFSSVYEEIFSCNPNTISIEELEDSLSIAKSQLLFYEYISNECSVEVYKLKNNISKLKSHKAIASDERDKLVIDSNTCKSAYYELIKQRDCLEHSLVKIKEEHSKNQDLLESLVYSLEKRKQEIYRKEKSLQNLLDEYKIISENTQVRKEVQKPNFIKIKDTPKTDIKPFPASSFSFNIGLNKSNQSKERVIVNRSFNNGEKSSRSSNVSNNTSMILDYWDFIKLLYMIKDDWRENFYKFFLMMWNYKRG